MIANRIPLIIVQSSARIILLIPIICCSISCHNNNNAASTIPNVTQQPQKENISTEKVVGKVLDVHMLGAKAEIVTMCHFDPNYVVCLQTQNGERNLSIHSPAKTFMSTDPIGRTYIFHIRNNKGVHFLEKVEEIIPDKSESK